MRRATKALLGSAVAAAVVALLLVPGGGAGWFASVAAGTGDSMSHGPRQPGILDDGDLAAYERAPSAGDITDAVAARAAGLPQVAGDWGDVLLFRPDGAAPLAGGTAQFVVHRALVWVAYNATTGLFDVPELGLSGVMQVTLHGVGTWDAAAQTYARRDFTLVLVQDAPQARTYPAGQHSGWVTKGDHNEALDQQGAPGAAALSALVQPDWVEGRLLHVVDIEALAWQSGLGVGAAVLVGVAWLLVQRLLADAGAGRAKGVLGPRCQECRAPLGGLAFCAGCGAERVRRDRYPDAAALAAARALDRDLAAEPARSRRWPSLAGLGLGRAKCEACGTPFGEGPFCLRCGFEKQPRHRYASPEAREAARRRAAERRR